MKRLLIFLFCFWVPSSLLGFEVKEIAVGSARHILKWDVSRGPIRILLNDKGSDNVPIANVEKAIQKALDVWQNVPNQSMRFQYAGRSSSALANSSDQINSIVWIEKNWQFSSSTLAITRYSYFITDRVFLADADILVNGVNYKWTDSLSSTNAVSIPRALIHELGHLLGLAHSSVLNSRLYPTLASKPTLALSADDKAGLQYLYGAPISDFRLVSPPQNATYPVGMSQQGLPLPIFRWNRGGFNSFSLEFSDTPGFQRKITIPVGSADSYGLKAAEETQIENLSSVKKVYWRVVSGNTKTAPRALRFKSILGPGLTYASAWEEDPMILILLIGTIVLGVLLVVSVLLFFVSRKQSA